ncbi:MAG TPA: hypothetical protein VN673_16965, partial [Clostridia bacterium]|nr:hypothetical protein [Clostridia bacterium]
IRTASVAYQKDPLWSALIPNWNRIESALPTFLDELREAVRLDNELLEIFLRGTTPKTRARNKLRLAKETFFMPPSWPEAGSQAPSI